jgi:hypothetical protein
MLRKPSFAVFMASLYLLVYYFVFYYGQDTRALLWMFMGAPVVLGWLAYTVIRFGKFEGRELQEHEEWGYSDKQRHEL